MDWVQLLSAGKRIEWRNFYGKGNRKKLENFMWGLNTMKILGICATHASKRPSTSMFLLEEALKAAETKGATTEAIRLVDYTIMPCTGCSICMMFKPCPLLKDKKDQMKELNKR